MHSAYQPIIGMGSAAVPLILRELEREPRHWFQALRAITEEDPVPASDRGRVTAMAAAWLEWGRGRGLEPQRRQTPPRRFTSAEPQPVQRSVERRGATVIIRQPDSTD